MARELEVDEEDLAAAAPDDDEEERRQHIHLALLLLIRDTRTELHKITEELGRTGPAGLQDWFDSSYSTLLGSRTEGWALGRRLAGDTRPQNDEDARLAESSLQDDAVALEGFHVQLGNADPRYVNEDGTLNVDAVFGRLGRYPWGIIGAANEAAVLTNESLNPELNITYDWLLGGNEKHCHDCPAIARGGPYTVDTLPGYPGDGGTACGNGCLCSLLASNGFQTFAFAVVE